MLKNITFTILITIAFTATLFNFPTIYNIETSAPSKFCPSSFSVNDDNPEYYYLYEYNNNIETLYCIYDEQTLLLERSYYTYMYTSSYSVEAFLFIVVDFDETGTIIKEAYTLNDDPISIRILKIYDETSYELVTYLEQYINYETLTTIEIEGLDTYRLLNSENVYERINKLIANKSLD